MRPARKARASLAAGVQPDVPVLALSRPTKCLHWLKVQSLECLRCERLHSSDQAIPELDLQCPLRGWQEHPTGGQV